ncbi:MAG TPA: hypothetical protein VFL68_09285 [Pseudolabrys sp.]|jgi:hypothetical protein|nr:hypothetical protein [Pseudolabrys sp.]
MPTDTTARAQQLQPGAPDEADYHAFCTALSESARGRAFLAEYARRNRNTDTRPLLTAIERLQISLAADPAAPAEVLVKQKLQALLDDITTAQNEIEASVMAIRTAKLADLITMVEQRLVEIMAPAMSSPATREPSPPEEPAEEARVRLAVVPPSDQPELPIPSPAVAQPPIALVRIETAMAEVAFAEPQPEPLNEPKAASPAAASVQPAPLKAPMPTDPLAAIKMLSEEERLALFT